MIQPIIRIVLRYGISALFTVQIGDMVANDPDVVNVVTAAVSALGSILNERWWVKARNEGGPT